MPKKKATKACDSSPPPPKRRRVVVAADVWGMLKDLAPPEQEAFFVICIDIRNGLICPPEIVALGSVSSVEVHPREVFREAVRRAAAAVIVAHNHPSGDPTPSPEDIELTKRLRSSGDLLGIPCIDHVVFTKHEFRSIAERLGTEF